MIIIASQNGLLGMQAAMDTLKAGGSALDAVETGVRLVEANAEDHSVGLGGYPNILGKVEQDASIMDGATLSVGAVGAVKGYAHPITIARKVMETLPHVFLVGAGAERFAAEVGCEQADMLTEAAKKSWREKLLAIMPPETFENLAEQPNLSYWVKRVSEPVRAKGTINFIARDAQGNIACGVSTSGWYEKYPGRLGDSPLIGAGNYADNRYGAAACTGMGEMAIRAGTTRSLVLYLKMGLSLEKAGRQTMQDFNDLGGPYLADMNVIALDAQGHHAGFTNREGSTYAMMTDDMSSPVEVERTFVSTRRCWAKT